MGVRGALSEAVEDLLSGEIDLARWAAGLDPETAEGIEREASAELADLPTPIGPSAEGPAVDRRRALERIVGRLRARRGDGDAMVRAEREAWLRGGDHLSYLRALEEAGREQEAAVMARTLLAKPTCPRREELEQFLASLSNPPEGWAHAVEAFAEHPTEAAWDELWLFTPGDVLYERRRHTLALLRRLGVEPELLFRFATRDGVTPDAIGLVEDGLVDPRVVEERADLAPGPARPLWLGLAARAACVRGDRLGTVRLLRASMEQQPDDPLLDVVFVWEHADPELVEMLERAGIRRPRP